MYEPNITLAQALHQRLEEVGATQAQAAQVIGVSQARVSQWMRNGRPDAKSYLGLMKFLDVSPAQFGSMLVLGELLVAARDAADRRLEEPEILYLGDLVEGRTGAPADWPMVPVGALLQHLQ